MKFIHQFIYLLLATTLGLTACGGGGSNGGGENPSPAATGNTTESPTADLPGTIYYASYGTPLAGYDPVTQTEANVIKHAVKDFASVSADGQWLAWAAGSLGQIIEVKNVWDDSQSYTIKMGSDFHRVRSTPIFSPNGQNLLLLSDGDNSSDLELLTVRNRNGKILEIPYQNVKDITNSFFDDWAWLNDNAILITSGAYFFVIRDIYNPTLEIVQQYENYRYAPAFVTPSPDGTKLAYTRYSNIYIYDLQTNNETALTHDSLVRSISWSPDGKYIAFVTGKYIGGCDPAAGFKPTLHVMPTDLPETVRVVHGETPSSDQVRTLKWYSLRGYENVCVFSNLTFWTPKWKG